MAQETWHYLDNQFDNATATSFKLMNILNADHLARLQAQQSDADIAALLARTTPLHTNYNTAHIGPAHLEFVLAGYLSETFAIALPEGGSVTQNLTMNPAP